MQEGKRRRQFIANEGTGSGLGNVHFGESQSMQYGSEPKLIVPSCDLTESSELRQPQPISRDVFKANLGCDLQRERRFINTTLLSRKEQILQHTLNEPTPDLQAFYNLDDTDAQGALMMWAAELVENGLDNHIQHQKADGIVVVESLRNPSGLLEVVVTDNGTGVSERIENDLYELKKSHKDRTNYFGGNGAALKYIKDWTTENGGDLTYQRLPDGSEFTMSVDPHTHKYPTQDLKPTTSSQDARQQLATHYRTILRSLVAEDDMTSAEYYWTSSQSEQAPGNYSMLKSLVLARTP